SRRRDRPLVPNRRGRAGMGPAHGDRHLALTPSMNLTATGAVDTDGAAAATHTRVLVVDDHTGFRRQLRDALEQAGVDVVGEASCGEDALELVEETRPDVVVMELHMPGMGGFEATRLLASADPPLRVVVLTISDRDDDVIRAILAGASGYLLKDGSLPD